jgi:tryptophan halogenase
MKLRRVVLIGHGIAPAMAAVALRRAFGRGGLEVEWIETPGGAPMHQALASLPNLRAFHAMLGLNEAEVLRASDGTFTLGQQYLGFSEQGEGDFLHSYGPVGRPVASLPFVHFWTKARHAGLPARFEDFSREAVAARNARIRIADAPGAPATPYGYHLDAAGYAALLRAQAVRSGVTITRDDAPVAIVGGDAVSGLKLSDGRTVQGDLYVDAGEDHAVRSALGDLGSADAPISSCNRMMLASGRALRPLPLYSRVASHRAGWSALVPLQDRTGIAVAYDSAEMTEDEAKGVAGVPLASAPVFVPLVARKTARPWSGNVVALGNAGLVELVAPTGLHRLQIAITHLVSLFPVRDDRMPEAAIYNEELAAWHARLRDFDAARYALSQRAEPFWAAARARPRSAELDARIKLFSARGMISEYNQESFAADEWQVCFLGQGLMPRSWDPLIDRIDEQVAMADFRAQLKAIRAEVTAMDTHEAALGRALSR